MFEPCTDCNCIEYCMNGQACISAFMMQKHKEEIPEMDFELREINLKEHDEIISDIEIPIEIFKSAIKG